MATDNAESFDMENFQNDPELFDAYLEELIRTELRKPIEKPTHTDDNEEFHCECCVSDYSESEDEFDSGIEK